MGNVRQFMNYNHTGIASRIKQAVECWTVEVLVFGKKWSENFYMTDWLVTANTCSQLFSVSTSFLKFISNRPPSHPGCKHSINCLTSINQSDYCLNACEMGTENKNSDFNAMVTIILSYSIWLKFDWWNRKKNTVEILCGLGYKIVENNH